MPHDFQDTEEFDHRDRRYFRCSVCGVYDLLEALEPIKPPDFKFQYWHNREWVPLSCEEWVALVVEEE